MDAKFEYAKVSCTVNIVFQMTTSTHAQFPILPEESWVTEIIGIYVGYVWTGKFDLNADTVVEKMGKMRNPIGKRTLVVSLILNVNCLQHSFKFFSFFFG